MELRLSCTNLSICSPFWLQQAMLQKTSGHFVGKHRHEIGHYIRADFMSETDSL